MFYGRRDSRLKTRRILVTGAAGFIGSSIILRDLFAGEIIAIDSFEEGLYDSETKRRRSKEILDNQGIRIIEADLTKPNLPPDWFRDLDLTIHCAAMPGLAYSWENPKAYISSNVLSSLALCRLLKRHSPKSKLLHISTSSVYGINATGDENSILSPISPYGITKLTSEEVIKSEIAGSNLSTLILRLFSVFGPRQRPDMLIHATIEAALRGADLNVLGDGSSSRSFTYIDDVIGSMFKATETESIWLPGHTEIYNIGGGQVATVNQVVQLVSRLTNSTLSLIRGPNRPGDQKNTSAKFSKATSDFGYLPEWSLEQGIESQIAWQRDQMGLHG